MQSLTPVLHLVPPIRGTNDPDLAFGSSSQHLEGTTTACGLRELGAVLCSPCSTPTFLRTFLADVMCSMPKVLTDLQFAGCLYATGSFAGADDSADDDGYRAYSRCGKDAAWYRAVGLALGVAPFWIRLAQSLRAAADTSSSAAPHDRAARRKALLNALK